MVNLLTLQRIFAMNSEGGTVRGIPLSASLLLLWPRIVSSLPY
ncbi:hypothetical protein OAG69_00120 [bacterium]|nr:hypothetical protein [bacterium]